MSKKSGQKNQLRITYTQALLKCISFASHFSQTVHQFDRTFIVSMSFSFFGCWPTFYFQTAQYPSMNSKMKQTMQKSLRQKRISKSKQKQTTILCNWFFCRPTTIFICHRFFLCKTKSLIFFCSCHLIILQFNTQDKKYK